MEQLERWWITEGSLAAAAGTTSRNTRNTGDSTASTPRLGRMLVTSLLAHSVRLAAEGNKEESPFIKIHTDSCASDRARRSRHQCGWEQQTPTEAQQCWSFLHSERKTRLQWGERPVRVNKPKKIELHHFFFTQKRPMHVC